MSRIRARSVSATMVGLAAVGLSIVAMAGTASASGSTKVTPILECVWHVGSTNWLASWGYSNASSSTQTVPIGSSNSFSPGSQSQGQPTSFKPGTNDNVFTVPFVASQPPAWTLDGTTVSSSPSDKKCSSDPVPIIPGTNGAFLVLPIGFVALGILAVGFCCWRYDLNLIPGLRRSIARRPPPD